MWCCNPNHVLSSHTLSTCVPVRRQLEAMVKRLMKEVGRLQPASPLAHTPDLPEVRHQEQPARRGLLCVLC
jgi:hypothetical protein